jgi:NADPH:quinone reductase-like Zn-dependent oxidoreductase
MRAIVQDRYGSPDHLRLADVAAPALTDAGVLVRVHASSINAGESGQARGKVLIRVGT